MMRVVNGHKGCSQFRTVVTGIPAHSSETEQGVSAVEIAARLIGSIAAMRAENRRRAAPDSPFSPPYSSLAANLVQAVTQQHIMAGECRFRWEVRLQYGRASCRERVCKYVSIPVVAVSLNNKNMI